MLFSDTRKNFNEAQWEQEIKRDERRISGYFRELCFCLDLPGEEEIIFDNLSAESDLVPSVTAAENLRSWIYGGDDPEEDGDEDEAPARPRRPGSEMIDQIDHLVTEWNAVTASELTGELYFDGIGIGAELAKLLARVADWSDVNPADLPALRKTLGKRALLDINDTVGMLTLLLQRAPRLGHRVLPLVEELKHVRERLIDLLG